MTYRVSASDPISDCQVLLTPSKSISNRLLIIRALCDSIFEIQNLSTSGDTKKLCQALENLTAEINVEDAGTAFRFLVSLLSITPGEWFLTGSDRMKLRPIGPLVESLKALGADIEFCEVDGFPPLKITGKKIEGGKISIDRSLSSQFVSSLLMIAPKLEKGLAIQLNGSKNSDPYIQMTISLLRDFGVHVEIKADEIIVRAGKYFVKNCIVENDWSSASYWYLLCALNPGSKFVLSNLNENSIQGDKIISELMTTFGVTTDFRDGVVNISSFNVSPNYFEYNFSDCPDLVMTFAVLCAAKKISAKFTGVKSLRIKESNRLAALESELTKCGVQVQVGEDTFEILNASGFSKPTTVLTTHSDHRMAMAFAPIASVFGSIEFDQIDVVEKSYPEFWDQMKLAGVETNQV